MLGSGSGCGVSNLTAFADIWIDGGDGSCFSWVMVVTIKALAMQRCRLLATTFVSIFLYAVGIAALIQLGVDVAT
jgi:hypothetical protein